MKNTNTKNTKTTTNAKTTVLIGNSELDESKVYVDLPASILISGRSRTGKTYTVNNIAVQLLKLPEYKHFGATVISVHDVFDKRINHVPVADSGKAISRALSLAKRRKSGGNYLNKMIFIVENPEAFESMGNIEVLDKLEQLKEDVADTGITLIVVTQLPYDRVDSSKFDYKLISYDQLNRADHRIIPGNFLLAGPTAEVPMMGVVNDEIQYD